MREDFLDYCDELDLSMTLEERVEEIESFYEDICPEELEEIFITQSIDDEGTISFQSLWFFSESYVMEASNFRKKDQFDIFSIGNGLTYLEITKVDYDFDTATEDSRLAVDAYATPTSLGFSLTLHAVQHNCDRLRDLIRDYFQPRLT